MICPWPDGAVTARLGIGRRRQPRRSWCAHHVHVFDWLTQIKDVRKFFNDPVLRSCVRMAQVQDLPTRQHHEEFFMNAPPLRTSRTRSRGATKVASHLPNDSKPVADGTAVTPDSLRTQPEAVPGATAILASFVADTRYEAIPLEVRHEAKRLLLDGIGCASADDASSRALAERKAIRLMRLI